MKPIRREFKIPFLSLSMGRNPSWEWKKQGKSIHRNQYGRRLPLPYATAEIAFGPRLYRLHGWVNNEESFGLYWSILNTWDFSIVQRSCYGHNTDSREHCDRRGHWFPQIRRKEEN